jgi:hypothetical protein
LHFIIISGQLLRGLTRSSPINFTNKPAGRTGLTGFDFVNQIVDRCGLITIAREPDYCGGKDECDTIFDRMNQTLFAGRAKVI